MRIDIGYEIVINVLIVLVLIDIEVDTLDMKSPSNQILVEVEPECTKAGKFRMRGKIVQQIIPKVIPTVPNQKRAILFGRRRWDQRLDVFNRVNCWRLRLNDQSLASFSDIR